MGQESRNNLIAIWVALIALIGTIGAALISAHYNRGSSPATPLVDPPVSELRRAEPIEPIAQASGPLWVTSVLIGKAGSEPFVSEPLTRFSSKDRVSITVRFTASEEVARFPVRLSAQIASGLMGGSIEETTDISKPGETFWTFHFQPKEGWMGFQHFVWIRVNGKEVYSQVFDIVEE